MGCEVLLFCILLEVLGIMTRVFPDVQFSLHLRPQMSKQGEEDNRSKFPIIFKKIINLVSGFGFLKYIIFDRK